MATARKKPATAAQRAARAEFSRVMKSGGFGAQKKRKRNPVGRSGANNRDVPTSKLDFQRFERALSGAPKARAKKNPIARSRSNRSVWATNVGFPDFTRNSRALSGRKANPTKPVLCYVVHEARHGVKGKTVAAFPSKPAAVQFARAWTELHQCPAIIAGRGAR